ncbi:MAG: hypothetical protein H6659_10850 [Ardenticatenaceae bacterium]|nr:hypothetical protein [Ardenticatenaceae bacterium]
MPRNRDGWRCGHLLPPAALLDAAFQLLLVRCRRQGNLFAVSVDKVWLNGRSPQAALVGYATSQPAGEGLQGDIFVFCQSGQLR